MFRARQKKSYEWHDTMNKTFSLYIGECFLSTFVHIIVIRDSISLLIEYV